MSSFGSVFAPAAAAAGIGRSLALARAANPRLSLSGPFDERLDLALKAGVGGGAATSAVSIAAAAPPATDGADGFASTEALRVEHRAALAEFEERFRQLLRERGIDVDEGVVLQTDVHGDVRVVGDHPQRDAIERLLRDDVELRNLFVRIDGQASRLRAADFAAELARLQAEAPADAATRVQELLRTASPPTFSLTVRPHEAHLPVN